MKTKKITTSEILNGYDAVSTLYPFIPSLSLWRSWEYAAYKKFQLNGRILDLGCGDGRYFRLIWPNAKNTVGLDIDPQLVGISRQSGNYKEVHLSHACQVPENDSCFDHVFANCSLEHMKNLDAVLMEIYRCLKPEGTLLCSVVTDRFCQWSLLSNVMTMAGYDEVAKKLKTEFLDYHHIENPLSIDEWIKRFKQSGLIIEENIPILPKYNSSIFLIIDSLWHIKKVEGGEIGDQLLHLFSTNSNFTKALRKILAGLIEMENNWQDCSGAVFSARKAG